MRPTTRAESRLRFGPIVQAHDGPELTLGCPVMTKQMTLLDWFQLAAIFAAGLFFAVKLWLGWFYVNMSLSGETHRLPRDDDEDDLAITITMTKGGTGSVSLDMAVVRVTWPGGESEITDLQDVERLRITEKSGPVKGVRLYDFDESWRGEKPYNLPPADSSIWSCHVVVPTKQVCTIRVLIIGKSRFNLRSVQWRASLISLPVSA